MPARLKDPQPEGVALPVADLKKKSVPASRGERWVLTTEGTADTMRRGNARVVEWQTRQT